MKQEELKNLLNYNPETGMFTWKRRKEVEDCDKSFNSKYAYKKAGSTDKYGNVWIKINKKSYKANKLAWLYVYGEMPDGRLVNLDHNKSNNKISNLAL